MERRNQCQKCLSDRVVWVDGRYGWYLANVTSQYSNGARFLRGPHNKTCPGSTDHLAAYDN